MKQKQKINYHSLSRYGTFLLAVTSFLSSLSYGESHTISVNKPDTIFSFGNPRSGEITIYPWNQNDNRMTFCTQKGSDPALDLYKTNECMTVQSDGKLESLYMSLASQVRPKQWYKDSPCYHSQKKQSVTYQTIVYCYRWLAKKKITAMKERVAKIVKAPTNNNEAETEAQSDRFSASL